ncbi:MAG TPA: hypothetical protein VI072_00055 [Polyangiaceae bacterium]
MLDRLLCGIALCAAVGCSEDPGAKQGGRDAGTDAVGPRDAASDVRAEAAPDASDASVDDLLSQTGLFEDVATERLAAGVVPYQPRYELWSDGAQKRRWLYLPPGTRIDSTNMDYWVYPQGTKLWKEFVRDGVRVETRLLHKRGADPSSWFMMAYQWNAQQSDAVALPGGASNVHGTAHDVPDQTACGTCHDNMPDRVLGVSAIQLSHALPGATLTTLAADGRLTTLPAPSGYTVPGTETERRALGYLHANCGNCHNPTGSIFSRVCLDLWLSTRALASVRATTIYASSYGVRVSSQSAPSGVDCRLTGQSVANSALYSRMNTRGQDTQMPPLASEIVDDAGLGMVGAWIAELAAAGACTGDCDAPFDAGTR